MRTTLTIPIWHPARPKAAPLALANVAVRHVDPVDAPVVAHLHRARGPSTAYRTFDGNIWMKAGENAQWPRKGGWRDDRLFGAPGDTTLTLAALDRVLQDIKGVENKQGLRLHPVHYEAVRNAFLRPLHSNIEPDKLARGMHFVRGDETAFDREIARSGDDVILIDDVVWQRTKGPVMEIGCGWNTSGSFLTSLPHMPLDMPPEKRVSAFDFRHKDRIAALCRDVFGTCRTHTVDGDVLAMAPDQQMDQSQLERDAVELAVWHFFWTAKWQGVASGKGEIVEAYVMSQDALEARWNGVADIDLTPRGHDDLAQHLWFHPAPEPDDLMPVLDKIVAAADGVMRPEQVGLWRVARHRGQEHMLARDIVKEEGLVGFSA